MSTAINITKEDSGLRLDKFLVKNFPAYSRSFWQKMVKDGLVLVSGRKTSPHYALKEGEAVEWEEEKIEGAEKSKEIDLSPTDKIKLEIVYEDENFLVVNKPAGLVVHPSASTPTGTLVNALLAHYPPIQNVGENPTRPGIVHRLDKDASGLMVAAKNQKAFEHLKNQFKNRLAKKEYMVLVKGEIGKNEGIIDLPIARSKSAPTKMVAKFSEKSRQAVTEFVVINRYQDYSLLNVRTKTGRTHQIRVHFQSMGHPVAGDKLYQSRQYKKQKSGEKLPRLFLHAYKLGFYDLQNNWKEFKIELPKELENFLKIL